MPPPTARSAKQRLPANVLLAAGLAVLLLAALFWLWWTFGRGEGVYTDEDGSKLGVFDSSALPGEISGCKTVGPGSQVCSPGRSLAMSDQMGAGEMRCAKLPRTLPDQLGSVDLYCCGASPGEVKMALSDAQRNYLEYGWSSQVNEPPAGAEWTRCYRRSMCGGGTYKVCAQQECYRKGMRPGSHDNDCNSRGNVWSMRCI